MDLSEAVKQRRAALGLTQASAALRAGLSQRVWQKVETGGSVLPSTLAAMSSALEWPSDALTKIANGQPASDLPDVAPRVTVDSLRAMVALLDPEDRAKVRRFVAQLLAEG